MAGRNFHTGEPEEGKSRYYVPFVKLYEPSILDYTTKQRIIQGKKNICFTGYSNLSVKQRYPGTGQNGNTEFEPAAYRGMRKTGGDTHSVKKIAYCKNLWYDIITMPMIVTQQIENIQTLIIFRGNMILLTKSVGIQLPDISVYKKCIEYQLAADWFIEPDHGYAALRLEEAAPEPTGCIWTPMRELFAIQHPIAPVVCRAAGLMNWRIKSRFCGKCGSHLHNSTDETARVCLSCGSVFYPVIAPAMIVLVEKGDSILLARHKQRNTDMFTCLAGYVEHGENLEQCVAREVLEEAGITITNIRYMGSQSWPFPDQLMVAFKADWQSGDLHPDDGEINELRWFKRDQLPVIPGKGSVAYNLITGSFRQEK